MKNIAIPIIKFFLISLFFCLILDQLFTFLIKKNHDFKPSKVVSGTINADIIFQGPSNTLQSINSVLITKQTNYSCYNLGCIGADYDDNIALLHLYLSNNKLPLVIIRQFMPRYFHTKNSLSFHSFLYTPFVNDPFIESILKRRTPLLYNIRQIPLIKYSLYNRQIVNEVLKGGIQLIKGSNEVNFTEGFQPKIASWDIQHYQKFIKDFPDGYNIELDTIALKSYVKYIKLTKKYNVPLIIISPPVYQPYKKYELNRSKILDLMDSICENHSVPFYRMENIEMQLDSSNFWNMTHVNLKGANLYSLYLSKFLKNTLK